MADLTTRPAATTANDADLLYLHQAGVSKKITGENFRKLFGIRGNWDATPVASPAAPDAGYNLEASVAGASPTFLMTPANGASPIKLAGSTAIAKQAGARSARVKASTDGGNFLMSGFVWANASATPADVLASIGFGVTGTCTHVAAIFLDNTGVFGPGLNKLRITMDDPVNGLQNSDVAPAGSYVAGDDVYMSYDSATGQFVANVNAGPDLPATPLWDVTSAAALRLYALTYFSANPPVFTDGTLEFDPSTTAGGRTGFATLADADPPAGAVDWSRWAVTNPGTYGGKNLVAGDVVEFYNTLASIIVYPASFVSTADVEEIAQAIADATVAAFNPPTREYDLETEYATLGGANPGEFQMGPLANGATLWSSAAGGALSALATYSTGYTPVAGDSFYLQFNEFDQVVSIGAVGTHTTAVATGWKYADYTAFTTADFMRTKGKRYQFVYTYIDGVNDKWMLLNPDALAWTSPGSGSLTAVADGSRGQPGVTESSGTTGNAELYVRLENSVRTSYNAEPFKPGQSCQIAVVSNTGRLRIMGSSDALGGITFTSNLPVQAITVGPITEPAVDIYGAGQLVTLTYRGSDTWHVHVSGALPGVREITGTTHTLTADNNGEILWFTNVAGCAVTLPKDATEALPPGFTCRGIEAGGAAVTYAIEAPDTLASKGGLFTSNGLYSEQRIAKKASGLWWLGGDLA